MTDIRTFPPSVTIERVATLTRDNFAYAYLTRPYAYYNNPYGAIDYYGARPTYDNSTAGKTCWEGYTSYTDRIVDDNSASTDIPTKTANTYFGWSRFFYPSSSQIFQVGSGIHADVMGDLLKWLDWAYARGIKIIWTPTFYNAKGMISMGAFGKVWQTSGDFETNVKAFMDGLFDSAITSPTYGFTFKEHPGLGCIECGNENTDPTYDNISTDQAGNIHANIVRIVWGVTRAKEVTTLRGTTIKIIPFSGQGGVGVDYNSLYGADARSQASTLVGNATVSANVFTKTAHGLNLWDMVLCEAVDFPDTYTSLTQEYFVVNVSGSTFQLSLTSGGSPVSASSNSGIVDVFANSIASNIDYQYKQATNLCTYDHTTNLFTQASHGLTNNWKVIIVGRIGSTSADSGLSTKRRYWVNTVPTADTFTVSATFMGATLAITGTPNVKVNKNVPSAINGDTGECKHIAHYVDAISHHCYENATTSTDYLQANNKYGWDRAITTCMWSINMPYELYRNFGMWNRGPVARSGNTLTTLINLNLNSKSRLTFQGTPPAPLALDKIYYAVNINNGTKSFDVSETENGTAITLTSAGTSPLVNLLHPWFGNDKRPAIWNTESAISESPSATAVWGALTKEARKQLFLRWYLGNLLLTSDGNDGFGVNLFHGTDIGVTWANGTGTATIGSSGGNLQITIAGDSTPVITTTEQFYLETGANAITDGTNTPLAANSNGYFDILSKTSGTTYVLNTPYTGGAIAGVSYRLARYYHAGAEEWKWMVNLLTSGELSLGRTAMNADSRYGIFFAVKGVGAWYFDSTGTMRQW